MRVDNGTMPLRLLLNISKEARNPDEGRAKTQVMVRHILQSTHWTSSPALRSRPFLTPFSNTSGIAEKSVPDFTALHFMWVMYRACCDQHQSPSKIYTHDKGLVLSFLRKLFAWRTFDKQFWWSQRVDHLFVMLFEEDVSVAPEGFDKTWIFRIEC